MRDEYECAMCHGVFKEDRPKEEALAELEQEFPGFTPEDCDLVCDDCWNRMGGSGDAIRKGPDMQAFTETADRVWREFGEVSNG